MVVVESTVMIGLRQRVVMWHNGRARVKERKVMLKITNSFIITYNDLLLSSPLLPFLLRTNDNK